MNSPYKRLKNASSVRFLLVTPTASPSLESIVFSAFQPSKAEFEYELVEHDLGDVFRDTWNWSVRFTAVSYAWGSAPRSRHFRLRDGSSIIITPGLESAISKISAHALGPSSQVNSDSWARIWIDQICIDQENFEERQQQVSLMRNLYEKATGLIIWLGDGDIYSRRVVEMVRTVGRLIGQDAPKAAQRAGLEKLLGAEPEDHPRVSPKTSFSTLSAHSPRLARPQDQETSYETSLMKFFDRSWFGRAWTFQEAVLPRKPEFLVGGDAFSMQHLLSTVEAIGSARMARMVYRARQDVKTAAFGYQSLLAIEATRYQISGEQSVREFLHFVSELAPYYKTTDPRDLCYAFLGFQKNSTIDIRPDYSVSTEEVYVRTAKAIVDGSRSLELFGVLHRGPAEVLTKSIPSWAPDWSAEPLAVPLHASHISTYFSASRKYDYSAVPNGLAAEGKVIDTVSSVFETNHFRHPPTQNFDIRDLEINNLFDLNRLVSALSRKLPKYNDAVSRRRILRAILADGANPGAAENILQREACYGLADWRIDELLQAYDLWKAIQENTDKHAYYEAKLNAEALLAYSGVIKNRGLIATQKSRLGITSTSVKVGDLVAVLHGSRTPIILRPASGSEYVVVGQAYVEGVMKGEAVDWKENEADTFVLA